ncbi:MAG: hypothetical protein JSU82_13370 [Rhodospirillales bacterium]|nr:MAG: hypothetical protein JSU82_13370 [Rhodospirillales bacterium]
MAIATDRALAQSDADQAPETTTVATSPQLSDQDLVSDPELETGWILHSARTGDWNLRLFFPFSVGLTEFDFDAGISLDNVTTVSVVPTLEFIVPLNNRWTFLPFIGAGGAVAVGDQKTTSGESSIAVTTGGLRAQRWQPFGGRYVSAVSAEARYNAAMTPRDGLLGDWGSLTGAVELRRSFGAQRNGPRLQAGVYAQGFWYWDPIEIEIEGVTPTFLDNQREFGISLGGSTPVRILGINVPRIFFGVRTGEGLRSLQLRFGRL